MAGCKADTDGCAHHAKAGAGLGDDNNPGGLNTLDISAKLAYRPHLRQSTSDR